MELRIESSGEDVEGLTECQYCLMTSLAQSEAYSLIYSEAILESSSKIQETAF